MSLEKLFVTNRYWPVGSITATLGPLPAGMGVPVRLNVPSEFTLKIEMVLARELAA